MMYKYSFLVLLLILSGCQTSDEPEKETFEDGNTRNDEVQLNEYQRRKSEFRFDQQKNKYKLNLIQECISDTSEKIFLEYNKLQPYSSEVLKNGSETMINFIFNDDCCAKHVSSVTKFEDSISILIEQNSQKVCECICPYEYQLVFEKLDSSIQNISINGHKLILE